MTPPQAGMPTPPKVFLSYAWEDRALAKEIAHSLMAGGIDTWWAEWSIGPGDSLPQKINEGLGGCTHFVVLLTPVSLEKPWVQTEMDAALVRRIREQVKFIPLRHGLSAERLPPLLSPLLSPEIGDPPDDLGQLVASIHGVSRKPPLGPVPEVVRGVQQEGYSAAANAVARIFVERSMHGLPLDPQISVSELVVATGLERDDVIDGIHELNDALEPSPEEGSEVYWPREILFARFDSAFCEWNPEKDAVLLAANLVNDRGHPTSLADIADRYGWPARRLNPAIAYLDDRGALRTKRGFGNGTWLAFDIEATPETRRLVRARGG